ncbi:MAG TPA: FAD-binding protein [Planctomycetaceae bacterium]|nr:FAD-binding protein [Planctomycetaceae bacterium]
MNTPNESDSSTEAEAVPAALREEPFAGRFGGVDGPTRDRLLQRLAELLPPAAIVSDPSELIVYEQDAYLMARQRPDLVVLPSSTEQVAAVVRLCNELGVPFLPRGAGTSLAGGCIPVGGGVMITLTRMNRVLEINTRDRYSVVEAGVVNQWLAARLEGSGFHYAPDPSSQSACTIGGNIACNAGGPHTLKYGVTVNHVLGIELVLSDGRVVRTGGATEDNPGYDLTGLIVGSEGTFGICTKAILRLTRDPESYRTMLCVFDTVASATEAVSQIIGAGMVPLALEMMDRSIIRAVEEAFHFGLPVEAEAVLIIEVDGLEVEVDAELERMAELCRRCACRQIRQAADEAERQALWQCRKKAFGALGRLSPSYCTQDVVVPRTRLPEMLRYVGRISDKYRIPIANVFHAGDGNLHPILLFNESDMDQVRRVHAASHEIIDECIRCGGTVTGEHGIGIEKVEFMPKLYSPEDLSTMIKLREVFNPRGLCSAGKVFPEQNGK